MRLREEFVRQSLFGEEYLMPIGQGVAEFRRGLKLNEVGAFLVRLLEEEHTLDELLDELERAYPVEPEQRLEMRQDVETFTNVLLAHGYVRKKDDPWEEEMKIGRAQGEPQLFAIGPFVLEITGDRDLTHEFLSSFAISEDRDAIRQRIALVEGVPFRSRNGRVIIRNEELILMETSEGFVFLLHGIENINELYVDRTGEHCICYYSGEGRADLESLRESIFHALRFAFLVLAGNHGVYAVHSASLCYRGKAWLFSGPSGMGKSTHVALWKQVHGTPCINGDLNLIGFEKGHPVVYGIPWCGTSETYENKTYPLGGITFLRRAEKDYVERPSQSESAMLVMNRVIYPIWTKEALGRSADFAQRVVQTAGIYRLHCTKRPSAAVVMREAIDGGEEGNTV